MVFRTQDYSARQYFINFKESTNESQVEQIVCKVWSSLHLTYSEKLKFTEYVSLWNEIPFDTYSSQTSFFYKGINLAVKKAKKASFREPKLTEFLIFLIENLEKMNLPAKLAGIYCCTLTRKDMKKKAEAIQTLEKILNTSKETRIIESCKILLSGLYSKQEKKAKLNLDSLYGANPETAYKPDLGILLVKLQEQINESQKRF